MREKLIDVFCAVLGVSENRKTDEAYQFVDEVIANGVTVQKWIPVTERLPDKGVIVLVSDGSDYPETAELVLRAGGRLIWENGNFREVKYITHWMPLPEPPKGE